VAGLAGIARVYRLAAGAQDPLAAGRAAAGYNSARLPAFPTMSLASAARSRSEWEDLSTLDPLFAVLSQHGKRGGGWDAESFFATGEDYVRALMVRAAALGLPAARASALDYDTPGCRFERLDDPAALPADAFDLVLCKAVVQHLPGRAAQLTCLAGLVRALRPGGLLAVQVPSRLPLRRRIQLLPRAYRVLRGLGLRPDALYRRLRLTPIRTTPLARRSVEQAIRGAGGGLLAVDVRVGGSQDETYYAGK
jgi:SAM-dependent methyltransferase